MRTIAVAFTFITSLALTGCEETPPACTEPSCAAPVGEPQEVALDPNRPQPTPNANSWGRASRVPNP